MTFEDDKLQQAVQFLRDMEKECASDIGWLKSVKTKVFGDDPSEVRIKKFYIGSTRILHRMIQNVTIYINESKVQNVESNLLYEYDLY